MKHSLIFIAACVLIQSACVRSIPPTHLTLYDTIRFATGYSIRQSMTSIYRDRAGVEYIVLTDPMTAKCTKFFTLDGKEAASIPLDQVVQALGEIGSISVISTDSLLALSSHHDRLAVFSHTGSVYDVVELDSISTTGNGNSYDFRGSSIGSSFFNGDLYLKCSFVENKLDSPLIWWGEHRLKSMRSFYSKANESPLLVKINPFSRPLRATYHLAGFYSNIMKEPFQSIEPAIFDIIGDTLYLSSVYLDSILMFDPIDFRKIGSFPIGSKLSKSHTTPVGINQAEADSSGAFLNRRLQTQAGVQGIVRDERSGNLLVVMYHPGLCN